MARAPGYLSRRPLRPSRVPRTGNWQGPAQTGGRDRSRKELRAAQVVGAGLEYAGHRFLSRHGIRVYGRVDQCAHRRRSAGPVGGSERAGGCAMRIRVIGGGLAGPEAALTAARLGCAVDLYEMRTMIDGKPRLTPAHQTTEFGELVCSNSLKSESPNTAPWLLKQEMRRGGSALLRLADESAVPAGHALAVDRVEFSRRIAEAIAAEPAIRVIRKELTRLDESELGTAGLTILATGPLTSDALSAEIERITGSGHLAFYDSISPIVDAESIN